MKPLKGTQTAQNLLKAFAVESQAKNRYTFWAEVAHTEGYEQIAGFFVETARNEEAHARRFYSFLCEEFRGEAIGIEAAYPVGLGSTCDHLRWAAEGEYDEWSNLYPAFGDVAEEEGFAEIAACFRTIAKAEINHETRFNQLRENLEAGRLFERNEETEWKCEQCGYIHRGKAAPQKCPACLYPQGYFSQFCENY